MSRPSKAAMSYFSRVRSVVFVLAATSCVLPEGGGNPAVDRAPFNPASGGTNVSSGGAVGARNTRVSAGGNGNTDVPGSLIAGGTTSMETINALGGSSVSSGGLTSSAVGGSSTLGTLGGATSGGGPGFAQNQSTGGECAIDTSAGGSGVVATSVSLCDRVAATCGERYYPVAGHCMRPSIAGDSSTGNPGQDGALGYDPSQSPFLMNWVPGTILAYKLNHQFSPSLRVVSLGAGVVVDPDDPIVGVFRLALYDSDPVSGLPNQIIAETDDLTGNNPEECLLDTPTLVGGGQYWLMLRVPSDENAVHVVASNVDAAIAVPGTVYADMQVETSWPSGGDWGAKLLAFPPPPGEPGLATVPHMFLRYLPSL